MTRMLVVDDEALIRTELDRMLRRAGYEVALAASVPEALAQNVSTFDLIIADVRLPGPLGTDLIAAAPGVPVLVMTSYATVRGAVEVMKDGAVDYLPKPFDHEELLASIQRLLNAAPVRTSRAPPESTPTGADDWGILGNARATVLLRERIRKLAPSDAVVLVRGESGTGKELVARALHEASRRRGNPFIAVNCAAIPETLVESELFGHERGAFTGATDNHVGLLQAADGGTLFFDEIGELPAGAQARLLRFLQTGEVRRVGSTRTTKVRARVVAATHRDLAAMVQEGTFRGDLYFRLRVLEVNVPTLAERIEDVPILARALLARKGDPSSSFSLSLSPEAEQALSSHAWPGNVRELENAIERAAVLCDGDPILPEHLALEGGGGEPAATADGSMEDYFRRFVLEHQGLLTETEMARRLGMSRKTLWERRQRLGLTKPR